MKNIASQLTTVLNDQTEPVSFEPVSDLKVYSDLADDGASFKALREEYKEEEQDQKSSSILSIKVKQPITFEVAPEEITDFSQKSLKQWADEELRKVFQEWQLRSSSKYLILFIRLTHRTIKMELFTSEMNEKPKILIKFSEQSPSAANVLIIDSALTIEVDFE